MDARAAVKEFGLSIDTLHEYERAGLLRQKPEQDGEYLDEDIDRLGLIDTLLKAGFTTGETKKYLDLGASDGTSDTQIRMLRKQRTKLLADIHGKQQTLDRIDFIIWDKQRG